MAGCIVGVLTARVLTVLIQSVHMMKRAQYTPRSITNNKGRGLRGSRGRGGRGGEGGGGRGEVGLTLNL